MLTLQGFGIPTSPFQTLSVSLLGSEDRACIVQSSNSTRLHCMLSLSTDPSVASETAEIFDIQLTANGESAFCLVQENCQTTLRSPDKFEVLGLASSTVPYKGNVTVILEDALFAAGERSKPCRCRLLLAQAMKVYHAPAAQLSLLRKSAR